MLAFGLLDGTFIGFGSVLSVIFIPEGFTSSEISGLGGVTIICGVVGSLIAGILLQKYHKYKFMLIGSGGFTTLLMFIGMIAFKFGDKWSITIIFWLAGFCIVPAIPICMNFADELCFP